jgi:hypothetical protein
VRALAADGDHRTHGHACRRRALGERDVVGWVVGRDVEHALALRHTQVDRYDTVVHRDLLRQRREDLGSDLELRERDPRATELMGQQLRQLERVHQTAFDQELTQAAAVRTLDDEHLVELHLRQNAGIEQKTSERSRSHHRAEHHGAPRANLVAALLHSGAHRPASSSRLP